MINKLSGLRTYLAGPIDSANDLGAGWRKDIGSFLINLGVSVYNPLEKPVSIGLEDFEHREERRIAKDNEDWDVLRGYMKKIRQIDLRMVDVSDFVICYLDHNIKTCGSYEEIFMAEKQRKPVLIVSNGGIRNLSDWMFGAFNLEHMFDNWAELKWYLNEVNTIGEKADSTGRWVFFDNLRLKELQTNE